MVMESSNCRVFWLVPAQLLFPLRAASSFCFICVDLCWASLDAAMLTLTCALLHGRARRTAVSPERPFELWSRIAGCGTGLAQSDGVREGGSGGCSPRRRGPCDKTWRGSASLMTPHPDLHGGGAAWPGAGRVSSPWVIDWKLVSDPHGRHRFFAIARSRSCSSGMVDSQRRWVFGDVEYSRICYGEVYPGRNQSAAGESLPQKVASISRPRPGSAGTKFSVAPANAWGSSARAGRASVLSCAYYARYDPQRGTVRSALRICTLWIRSVRTQIAVSRKILFFTHYRGQSASGQADASMRMSRRCSRRHHHDSHSDARGLRPARRARTRLWAQRSVLDICRACCATSPS